MQFPSPLRLATVLLRRCNTSLTRANGRWIRVRYFSAKPAVAAASDGNVAKRKIKKSNSGIKRSSSSIKKKEVPAPVEPTPEEIAAAEAKQKAKLMQKRVEWKFILDSETRKILHQYQIEGQNTQFEANNIKLSGY